MQVGISDAQPLDLRIREPRQKRQCIRRMAASNSHYRMTPLIRRGDACRAFEFVPKPLN